jgi:hypothetical protein
LFYPFIAGTTYKKIRIYRGDFLKTIPQIWEREILASLFFLFCQLNNMRFICFNTFFFLLINLAAQDITTHSNQTISDKYLTTVSSNAADLENKSDKNTKKVLAAMVKEESKEKYQSLEQKLETAISAKSYALSQIPGKKHFFPVFSPR